MEEYISAYEYENNVNPTLLNIPISKKNIDDCNYGITFIDFSELFNVNYKSTSPNLLASFIKIENTKNIQFENNNIEDNNSNFINGTSHLFYILQGSCKILIDDEMYDNEIHDPFAVTLIYGTLREEYE